MAESSKVVFSTENGVPAGLTRIRTLSLKPPDESFSGHRNRNLPPAPIKPKSKVSDEGRLPKFGGSKKGFRRGKKITRWLTSYLSKNQSENVSNASSAQDSSSVAKATDEGSPGSIKPQEKRSYEEKLLESAYGTKVSKGFKSFSHELGLGGGSGVPMAYSKAHSYGDLRELLGSLQTRFDAAKEVVNMELASFLGDVMDYLHQSSSSVKGEEMLNELLILAQQCIRMTSLQFRAKCEGVVQNLTEKRQLCEKGLMKWLFTRILFILTRCTRLLQLQKATEPMPEKALDNFKNCLESVPSVEINWKPNPNISTSDRGYAVIQDGDAKLKTDSNKVSAIPRTSFRSFEEPTDGSDMTFKKDTMCFDQKSHPKNHKIVTSNVGNPREFDSSLGNNVVWDSFHKQQLGLDAYDALICRICEEIVPTGHLEFHSYICALADKSDFKYQSVDERLSNLAELLERIMESRSFDTSCSSPENSRSQATKSLFEVSSPKISELPNKGVEEIFEDEMHTACLDDCQTTTSIILKGLLALKLGSHGSSSITGSMTSGSSSNTPRDARSDLFWLEYHNPSQPEDVDQMFKLAEIARCAAATNISKEGSCEILVACIKDLQEVLQNSKLQALVIDTFGGRIENLMREKYMLACEQIESSDDDKTPKKSSRITSNDASQGIVMATRVAPSNKERTSIDDFEIMKPISRGAFGKVFLARKRTTGDLFAIKALKKLDMIRKNDIERILAERDILIAVRNPFVVRFYYSFTSKDNLYLVMEYLNGGDLYSLLRKVGCLEEDVARMYAAELVLALEYLHSVGIVHRDLKPDNILIARDGHIKLTDFGLSKIGLINSTGNLYGAERESKANLDIENSNCQQIEDERRQSAVGTPDYLAPEIILGTHHGYAADWWSVGIILFEFITGIPPFAAESPEIIFDNILNREIPWPDVPNEMSLEAQDLINRFLILEPNHRLGAKGSSEVKAHPFFKGVDWDNLTTQKAAFVPQPDGVDDTSYFLSRYDRSFSLPEDSASSDSASETSSSCSNVEVETDRYDGFPEFDSFPLDLSSINFSFKNLSQLVSINHDVLLGKDPTKCSCPSQILNV